MLNIEFTSWKLYEKPYGLKNSEFVILRDYIGHLHGFDVPKPSYSIDETSKPPPPPSPVLHYWAFQVYLLGGFPPPPNSNYVMFGDWERVSSLKADAIERVSGNYTIYEIKSRADVCVLGQLLTYRWLFEEVFGYPRNTKLVLVCDFIVPGIIAPLLAHGIEIHCREFNWQFPANYSALDIRREALAIGRTWKSGRK